MRCIAFDPGKQLEEPKGYFRPTLQLVCTHYPAYSLPTEVDEGPLAIGSVSGLRWPDDWAASETQYDVSSQLALDGTPYSVDKTTNRYETQLDMLCNQSKAAALVYEMTTTVRNDTVSITPPSNTYLFGRDNSDVTYTCDWINPVLEVVHTRFNAFSFPLHFHKVS